MVYKRLLVSFFAGLPFDWPLHDANSCTVPRTIHGPRKASNLLCLEENEVWLLVLEYEHHRCQHLRNQMFCNSWYITKCRYLSEQRNSGGGLDFLNYLSVFRWDLGYKPCIFPALKAEASHNHCCIHYWGCSWPSGPLGCVAGEALRSRDKLCWGCCQALNLGCLCYACTHSLCHTARTAWPALWRALKWVRRNVCIFGPKYALQWRVVHQPSLRGGNGHEETEVELPGTPGFGWICVKI